jgi:hypothetical protein
MNETDHVYLRSKEDHRMKYVVVVLSVLVGSYSLAFAQGGAPSGRGSTTGDPAASSANPKADAQGTTGRTSSRSGSGTSASGGKDENGDQGRDKAPESNMTVRERPDKPNIPNPAR